MLSEVRVTGPRDRREFRDSGDKKTPVVMTPFPFPSQGHS